jgi:hypothetical protein
MKKHAQLRTLAMCLVLASTAANAGLFSKKAKPAPPPPPPPAPVVVVPPPPPPAPIPLEFSGIQTDTPLPAPMDRIASASQEVLDTLQWVSATKDNVGLPFVVVDKVNARAYAFTPYAQLQATAPVLLGMGQGDKALVSQDAPMSSMTPDKRITPAGRYVSKLVIDNHGKVVLLVDGPNLITMHIVAKGTPAQRRAERLASLTTDDNRVSFGCINVPPNFFTSVVDPAFRPGKGIVYILPEKTTAGQLFGFAPTPRPAAPANLAIAAQPVGTPAGIQTSLQAPQAPVAASLTAVSPVSLQAPQASATMAPASTAPAATFAPPASFVPAAPAVAPVSAPPAPGEGTAAGDTTAAK